jgi:hypothetical protein
MGERMKHSHVLFAASAAAMLSFGALADDKMESSPAVETLKSKLPSTNGFAVDNVRTMGDVTCINYRVSNDMNGETRAQAVVKGDEVLRSTTRSTKFQKAWNEHCAAKG